MRRGAEDDDCLLMRFWIWANRKGRVCLRRIPALLMWCAKVRTPFLVSDLRVLASPHLCKIQGRWCTVHHPYLLGGQRTASIATSTHDPVLVH